MTHKLKEAPRSIWAKIINGGLFATASDPREAHDDGQPVLRYLLVGDAETADADLKDAARELRTQVVNWSLAGSDLSKKAAISDVFEAALSKYAAAARAPLAAEHTAVAATRLGLREAIAQILADYSNNECSRDALKIRERLTAALADSDLRKVGG